MAATVDKQKITFKPKFIERYEKLTDIERFKEYSTKFLRRSIRVNTLKISIKEIKERVREEWTLTQIPWCKEGFWIEHKGEGKLKRRDIGNLPEHALGYFYVQEAASMIPPLILEPEPGETILDMCASPGSKTSQIAAMMQNKGNLVANDYKGGRLAALGLNMQRVGSTMHTISLMQGQQFRRCGEIFDRVLVDAPCSATGAIRKSLKTLLTWNPNIIKKLSSIQKQLLESGFACLKSGGTLVYSTCSVEPEEDEEVVHQFLEKHEDAKLMPIQLDIKRADPILEFEGKTYPNAKHVLRLWPQDNDTEGFFVAKIKKE